MLAGLPTADFVFDSFKTLLDAQPIMSYGHRSIRPLRRLARSQGLKTNLRTLRRCQLPRQRSCRNRLLTVRPRWRLWLRPDTEARVEASSAAHLTGLSAADIQTIDDKFRTLLDTVHANRPADDLEVIRKAWAFCLQQHEGQKRASGRALRDPPAGGGAGAGRVEDGLDGDCGGAAA